MIQEILLEVEFKHRKFLGIESRNLRIPSLSFLMVHVSPVHN